MDMENINIRDAAFISLERIERGNKYSNLEIDAVIKKNNFSGVDKAFYTALIYGVIERKITLDYIIDKLSASGVSKIDREVLIVLRIGLCQILFLDRIPDSAACDESVKLAKKYCKAKTSGFVNAVLREACRKKAVIPDWYPNKATDTIKYLSVKYSCEEWICGLWAETYGAERAESFLESCNVPSRLTLRVNTLKISRGELLDRLLKKGIPAEFTSMSPYGIILNKNTAVSELTEITEGLCYVQDEASQVCVCEADVKAGDVVVDICAAPGGKSFSFAVNMKNQGTVISCDLHESKLSLIERGAGSLGVDIISARKSDGRVYYKEYSEIADCVLCDVPCSGLGVIAKKPDIRYKKFSDVAKLPELQYEILSNAAAYVKTGGKLIYSTCTLNHAENEDVIKKFLNGHENFKVINERTFLPDFHKTDGFYLAIMIKY